MTAFNPGDRVRLSPQADPARREALGDMEGTVVWPEDWWVRVDWDTPSPGWNGPTPEEIELVVKEPEPADPDLQALRERLLELAVRAAGFEDTHATIVEAAQAFEAYITGGTK